MNWYIEKVNHYRCSKSKYAKSAPINTYIPTSNQVIIDKETYHQYSRPYHMQETWDSKGDMVVHHGSSVVVLVLTPSLPPPLLPPPCVRSLLLLVLLLVVVVL